MDIKELSERFEREMANDFHPESFVKTPVGEQYIKKDVFMAFEGFVKGVKSVKIIVPHTSIRWRDANTAKMEDILNAEVEMRGKFIDACRDAGIEPIFPKDIDP